eukprot:ANDGO_04327.mRNA.1 hypothetical protein
MIKSGNPLYRNQSVSSRDIELSPASDARHGITAPDGDAPPTHRKNLPLVLFIVLMICELYTSSAIGFLDVVDKQVVYMVYVFTTVVRCAIWLTCSIYLQRDWKKLLVLYCPIDNLFLTAALASVTYGFLNVGDSPDGWVVAALIAYPILLFCLSGNFRVMMHDMKWTPPRLIAYKLNRAYGVVFYLVIGSVKIRNPPEDFDLDMYLLFVFTTLAFLSELYFFISRVDGSENMKYNYEFQEED